MCADYADRLEYPITSGYIQVVAAGNTIPAFWAHPDAGGTYPGLVVIHDHGGLTASIRRLVRRLAERGHYVIAPDLSAQSSPAAPDDLKLPAIAAAINALRTHNHCNGDIAIIGFGTGGTLALQTAAQRDDLKAAVAFNGSPEPFLPLLAATTTPILAFYGGQDAAIPAPAIAELKTRLAAASAAHEVVVYAEAGRDFFDDALPGYAADAAADANRHMLQFLDAHLTDPSHPPDIRHRHF